jgi:endoglucanase
MESGAAARRSGGLEAAVTRREFLGAAALAAGLASGVRPVSGGEAAPAPRQLPEPSAKRLPRWRGFNLLEKFTLNQNAPYVERDFGWLERWGFDFVRLPMDYRCWTDPERPAEPAAGKGEKVLKEIDQAVEFGARHGIHVNLNLHRGPGYCVNPPKERLDLWKDGAAQDAFAAQWVLVARRYKGIPSARVSFDLLNEPADLDPATYARVVRRAVEAIRAEDPSRLIIADGLRWGTRPVEELSDLGIGQSTRGYEPMEVSHFRASWIGGSDRWPEPTWPLQRGKQTPLDKATLRQERIEPWKRLEAKGVGIHVGEWGAFNRTPHAVALAWMRDCLALWQEAGWGWALWNLRGGFGVLDSDRADVKYETFRGHKLDREMLEVLKNG